MPKRSHVIHQGSAGSSSSAIHHQQPSQSHSQNHFVQYQYQHQNPTSFDPGRAFIGDTGSNIEYAPVLTSTLTPPQEGIFAPWVSSQTNTRATQPVDNFHQSGPSNTSFIDLSPRGSALNMTMPLSQTKQQKVIPHFPTALSSSDEKSHHFRELWTPPVSPAHLHEDSSMTIDSPPSDAPPRDPRRKAIEDKAATKRKTATNRFAKVLANRINALPENGLANQLHMAADQMERDGKTIQQLELDKSVLQRKVQTLEEKVKQLEEVSEPKA